MGFRKSADGIATKGKTRGTAVSMGGRTGMKAGGTAKVKKMATGGGTDDNPNRKTLSKPRKPKPDVIVTPVDMPKVTKRTPYFTTVESSKKPKASAGFPDPDYDSPRPQPAPIPQREPTPQFSRSPKPRRD